MPPRTRTARPTPVAASTVAYSPAFIEAVSVALMSVAIEGPPEGVASAQLARYVVGDPRRQAERFAVALATDSTIVAAATTDEGASLDVLVNKVRAVWPTMAGETG